MMKFRNFYALATVLFLSISTLSAQSGKLDKGKRLMKELNYQGAIELFTAVLAKGDNPEAKINLAECYRKISDSENAEFLYGQVVRLPEAQPIHYLFYGEMLQRNGKCDLAKEWYAKFNTAVPEDVRGQYMSKACDYEQELKTKGIDIYNVQRATFNSDLDDFGATMYKDGIVFASERDKGIAIKRDHSWTGKPFLDLYYVPFKNNGSEVTYGRPEKFSDNINSKYHDASVTFDKGQESMLFTRNNYTKGKAAADDEGVMKLKIYSVTKKGKTWTNETALPFNSDEYSCAHPTLTEDGTKLYFASDMPGGFGGMDIYVSEVEGGKYGPPTNLGPGVNTEGHDVFPFIHKSGRLYFASDGHLGLGGMDILYVDPKDGGLWSAPENPGAPINTKDDDFAISLNDDGTTGFLSSDRTGGAGRDDVYSFIKLAMPLKVYVYDAVTMEALENATVTVDSLKKTFKTGKDGKGMVEMKFNTCADFVASLEGYEIATKNGCVKDATSTDNPVLEIPLMKVFKHTVEGVVFDLSSGLPMEGATVTMVGCDKADSTKTATTDANGRYSFELEKECCYKLKAEKDKYLSGGFTPDTVCTKGLKENKAYLVNLNLQPGMAPAATPPVSIDTTRSVVTAPPAKESKNILPKDKKKIDPKVVYFDPEKGLQVKNGRPFTGKKDGVTYKDGMIVNDPNSTAFVPSTTDYGKEGTPGYLLHIYYDFDQAFIRDESNPELNKLLKLMNDNPNYIIELSSHTDARGSNGYNNRLSQRRAESVVRWLVSKGVERDRLVPRGYGESITTNKCKNNIPCAEKEHQMNRRTEFRVLGCKGCIDQGKEKLSQPNQNTKVDNCKGCPF
jgi:outer membrane protein OmpA-like peptidoglycan-associated protein